MENCVTLRAACVHTFHTARGAGGHTCDSECACLRQWQGSFCVGGLWQIVPEVVSSSSISNDGAPAYPIMWPGEGAGGGLVCTSLRMNACQFSHIKSCIARLGKRGMKKRGSDEFVRDPLHSHLDLACVMLCRGGAGACVIPAVLPIAPGVGLASSSTTDGAAMGVGTSSINTAGAGMPAIMTMHAGVVSIINADEISGARVSFNARRGGTSSIMKSGSGKGALSNSRASTSAGQGLSACSSSRCCGNSTRVSYRGATRASITRNCATTLKSAMSATSFHPNFSALTPMPTIALNRFVDRAMTSANTPDATTFAATTASAAGAPALIAACGARARPSGAKEPKGGEEPIGVSERGGLSRAEGCCCAGRTIAWRAAAGKARPLIWASGPELMSSAEIGGALQD